MTLPKPRGVIPFMSSLDGGGTSSTNATKTADFSSETFDSNSFVRTMMLKNVASKSKKNESDRKANVQSLVRKTTAVEDFLQDINLQIGRVQKSLHSHVTDNQDFLMQRLSNVSLLFSDIKQVRAGISLLQTSTSRIRREVLDPLDDMRVQSNRLARVQQASMLLRRAARVLNLIKALRVEIARFPNIKITPDTNEIIEMKQQEQEQDTKTDPSVSVETTDASTAPSEIVADLPKAASLVHEIENMLENDSALVSVVQTSITFIENSSTFVKEKATLELNQAIALFDQDQISRSLQVFFNMKCLPEAIDVVLKKVSQRVTIAVVKQLDSRAIAREADKGVVVSGGIASVGGIVNGIVGASDRKNPTPSTGRTKAWRRTLWSKFDEACEEIHQVSLQVWNLQRILSKKRDPTTHVFFLDILKKNSLFQNLGRGEKENKNTTTEEGETKEIEQEKNRKETDKDNEPTNNSDSIDPGNEMGVVYAKYFARTTFDLSKTFLTIGRTFTFVKNMFIREYPSFREKMESVLRRLLQSTESRAKLANTTPIGRSRSEHRWMMRTTRPFLKVYLARSAARIQESLHMMGVVPLSSSKNKGNQGTPSNSGATSATSGTSGATGNLHLTLSVPSEKEMSTYIECVRHELRSVRHDIDLTNHVVHNVIVPSLVKLHAHLLSSRCLNKDASNFDTTTYGASRNTNNQNHNEIAQTTTSSMSNATNVAKTAKTAKTAKATNAMNTARQAGLNSFQVHNCTLALRLHNLVHSMLKISNDLDEERKSSRTALERASMWSTENSMTNRSIAMLKGCSKMEELCTHICGIFWSGLSFHLEQMVTHVHLEKYGIGTGSDGNLNRNSSWINKIISTINVIEQDASVSWMLSSKPIVQKERGREQRSTTISSTKSDVNGVLRTVLICRVVDAVCNHISMVRPIGSGGKKILSNDVKVIRQCMTRLHPIRLELEVFEEMDLFNEHMLLVDETESNRINRTNGSNGSNGSNEEITAALRTMNVCMSKSPSIRPSLCWHHLIKHGPPQLQLPHRRHGWSQKRYINYLERGGIDQDDTNATDLERFLRTPSLVRLKIQLSMSLLSFSDTSSTISTSTTTTLYDIEHFNHIRLANHLNNQQTAWNEILQSMDSYVQRLTVVNNSETGNKNDKNKEPCNEYKALDKMGMKSLQTHRTQAGRRFVE